MKSSTVSYGPYYDEFVKIRTLDDEERFKICMKMYKMFNSVQKLEEIIDDEALSLIKNSI